MWAMNLGKAVEIPKLNEAMAIELGATLLGEAIIFVSGAVLVTAEVVRRNKKDAALEQARREEIQGIVDRLRDMEIEASRQDAQLREITRLCMSLQGKEVSPVVQPTQQDSKVVTRNEKSVASSAGFSNSNPVLPETCAGRESRGRVSSRGIVQQAIESIINR